MINFDKIRLHKLKYLYRMDPIYHHDGSK